MSELKMEEISNDFAKLREMLGLSGADDALVGQAFGMLDQKEPEPKVAQRKVKLEIDTSIADEELSSPVPSPDSSGVAMSNPLSFLPAFSRLETSASTLEVSPFTLSQLGSMTPLGGLTPGLGQGQAVEWPAVNGVPVLAMGLQSTVQHVQGEDTAKIIVLRRIHKLGFSAPTEIINHFQKICEVDRLLLLPSRRKFGKLRPSSTGFLVCKSAEGAEKIFAGCEKGERRENLEEKDQQGKEEELDNGETEVLSTPEREGDQPAKALKGRKYGTDSPLLQTISGQVIEVGSFEYPTNVTPCTTPSAAAHALQQSIAALLTPMHLGSPGAMTPTNFGFGLLPPFTPPASTATPASTPVALRGEMKDAKDKESEAEAEVDEKEEEAGVAQKDNKALNPEAAVFVPKQPPSIFPLSSASPSLPEPSSLGGLGGVNPFLTNPLLSGLPSPFLPPSMLDPSVGLLAQQLLAQQTLALQLQSLTNLPSFQ